MARQPRFVIPGYPQHIIQRGNNRQVTFRTDKDHHFYLEKLLEAANKHQCDIHAYVLMPNHTHLMVTPHTENGISKMMQILGRYYVQYFNHRYKRTGGLWEGRYKATLIESTRYLLNCMRYIEFNPVRAKGMVKHAEEYPWSSYLCNALGENNELVTPHSEYIKLGNTKTKRQSVYRQLCNIKIPDTMLAAIREATNKAWVLGDKRFKNKIQNKLNRPMDSKGHGGDRKSSDFYHLNK